MRSVAGRRGREGDEKCKEKEDSEERGSEEERETKGAASRRG